MGIKNIEPPNIDIFGDALEGIKNEELLYLNDKDSETVDLLLL